MNQGYKTSNWANAQTLTCVHCKARLVDLGTDAEYRYGLASDTSTLCNMNRYQVHEPRELITRERKAQRDDLPVGTPDLARVQAPARDSVDVNPRGLSKGSCVRPVVGLSQWGVIQDLRTAIEVQNRWLARNRGK